LPTLKQVLEQYPDTVKLVFKNFPLRMHKFAMKAATAAMAAESQGKFWEFHDLLFENYRKLSDGKLKEIAEQLGLNNPEYEKTLGDPGINSKIRRDLMEGLGADVEGTPAVFVNGRLLRSHSLAELRAAVEKARRDLEEAAK